MLWVSMRPFHRVFRLRTLAWYSVDLNVRLSDFDAGLEGFDEHRDMIIRIATNKITHPEWFDTALSEGWERSPFHLAPDTLASLASNYASNRDEVDELVKKASSNMNVKKRLTEYLRIQRYLHVTFSDAPDRRETKYWTSRLAELDDTAEPIVAGDIKRLISQTKRDLKDSRFALSDRKAIKIPLNIILPSFERVGLFISVASALFLVSGFIYTNALYRFFEVPTHLYFSTSDYVDSSANHVYTVLFGVFFGLAAWFLGLHVASRKSVIAVKEKTKRPNYHDFFVIGFIGLYIVAGLFVGLLYSGRILHSMISMSVLFTGFWIAPYLASWFFDDRMRATVLLILVFSFTSYMYQTVYSDIYDILEGEESIPKLCKQVKLVPDNDGISPPCGSSVIGATKTHIFVFNEDKNTTIVLPYSRVIQGTFNSTLFEKNWVNQISRWLSSWILDEKTEHGLQEDEAPDNVKKSKNIKNQN